MRKIRKGDEIQVRTGKDRGKRGRVLRMVDGERVVVEGVNVVKKHMRPNPAQGMGGGIVEKEMPIPLSNVGIYNPVTSKADRVGIKFLADGKKVRIFKSTGEVIDV